MKLRCDQAIVSAATVLAFVGFIQIRVGAQTRLAAEASSETSNRTAPAEKPQSAGPARDGHVDLSGIWAPGFNTYYDLAHAEKSRRFDPKVTPQEKPSFQRWALEKIKKVGKTDEELLADEPCLDCEPLGVPGFMTKGGYPIEIVQTAKQLIVLNELDTTYRIIWIDGRPHPKDPDPQFNGDAVGHWEGDSLIVDVIAIDPHTWLNFNGWFPSDVMHLTERYNRPDSNSFVYQVTIDDPKVLTKPWKSAPWHYTLTDLPLVEYYCTDEKDYGVENPNGVKYKLPNGIDERYFDEQEYEQMKQQFPEVSTSADRRN